MAITRKLYYKNESGVYGHHGATETTYVCRVINTYRRQDGNYDSGYGYAWCATVIGDDGKPHEEVLYTDDPRDTKSATAEMDADSWSTIAFQNYELGREIAHRERFEKDQAIAAERARNAPAVGKKMVVAKGRKVPKGTVGVVAFIHLNGSVLLKDESAWQDRKANGVWVRADNLVAA